jgi:ATP-dependent helicase/nuclease subunit A
MSTFPYQNFPPTVLRANAGTGKTYNLVERFTALIDAGAAPDSILASTFTVKAASEIRDRIMRHLAQRILTAKTSIKKTAHDIAQLRAVIDLQHRLQICTLDSFMTAVVAQFSQELGLPMQWRIADEVTERRIFEQSLQRIVAGGETAQILLLLREFLRGDYRASVFGTLSNRLPALLSAFEEGAKESWHYAVPNQYQPLSKAERLMLHTQLQAYVTKLSIDHKPFKQLIEALRKIEAGFVTNDFAGPLNGSLLRGALTGNTTYYRKQLDPELVALLEKLVNGLLADHLAILQRSTMSAASLLNALQTTLAQMRKATGQFSFDTLKAFAQTALSVTALDEVYFRLDASIQHLLLDEFQDTSAAQWQMLQPIADEILAQSGLERSFFCVGDVKQAIYGWRGGVAEIFDSLNECWPQLEQRSLNRTYRSAPEIVTFLNQVFGTIGTNAALSEYAPIAQKWAARFEEHQSAIAAHGYIRMEVLPGPHDEFALPIEKRVSELVQRVLKSHPHASIGILVRSNSSAAGLVNFLRNQNLPFTISEEGGSTLDENHAVGCILALFQTLAHPSDSCARFHVTHSLLGTFLGISETAASFKVDNIEFSHCTDRIRSRIDREGLGRVIARLVEILIPFAKPKEIRRLEALINLAVEFEQSGGLHLEDFLTLVTARKIEDTNPATIRIMTVHKSKGLEFDAVILPDLDFNMIDVTREAALRLRPDPLMAPTQCVLYPSEILRVADPKLAELHGAAQATLLKESLSLLYVALTRARFGLFLLSMKPFDASKTPSWSGIIQAALGIQAKSDQQDAQPNIWHTGSWDAEQPITEPETKIVTALSSIQLKPLHFSTSQSFAQFLDPATLSRTNTFAIADLIGTERDRTVFYTVLFRTVRWIEDGILTPPELITKNSHLLLLEEDKLGAIQDFLQFAESVKEHPLFSKAICQMENSGGKIQLFQDLEYLVPRKESAEILRGRFMRVLLVRNSENTSAHIVIGVQHAQPADMDTWVRTHSIERDTCQYAAARVFNISEQAVQIYYLFVKDRAVFALKN